MDNKKIKFNKKTPHQTHKPRQPGLPDKPTNHANLIEDKIKENKL
jgi:hypothetical protein